MALGPTLTRLLKDAGLEGLTKWASDMIIEGASEDEVMVEIYDQPTFKQRFWMLEARSKAGFGAMSVGEILEYETTAQQMARAFGISLTRQEIDENIANDRSVAELQDVIGLASQAVHMSTPGLRNELNRLYGITTADLTRYWLDPKKQAPVLQRRFAAAQISEQATRSGWGQLSATQAEDLAGRGLDQGSAAEGFGGLVETRELFEGVDQTEEDISAENQLRLLTGDATLTEQVQKRGEKRAARFQEGGGFSTGQQGISGLGSAATQ